MSTYENLYNFTFVALLLADYDVDIKKDDE